MISATKTPQSHCGCARGKPLTRRSSLPRGLTGGAKRWRNELVPNAKIVVTVIDGAIAGFVTVDPRTLYLDQIVVAPEHWGSGVAKVLLDAARQLSPSGLDLDVNTDNARAIRFYEKCGFSRSGTGVNPISGKPVHRMSWRPQTERQPGQIS